MKAVGARGCGVVGARLFYFLTHRHGASAGILAMDDNVRGGADGGLILRTFGARRNRKENDRNEKPIE